MGLDAHAVVIIFETRWRNVGCLSICVFKTRSGPVNPWVPVSGSGDHSQALPRWVLCVGSLMELPLRLPTQLSQLEGGSRWVGGGTFSRLYWWQLSCLVGSLGWQDAGAALPFLCCPPCSEGGCWSRDPAR